MRVLQHLFRIGLLRAAVAGALVIAAPVPAAAHDPMTQQRLFDIVASIDPASTSQGPAVQFTIDAIPVVIITDPRADRMRAMVPIRSAETMTEAELRRVMQANFDSALDARYAIARGRLWAVFIHPLAALDRKELLSGLIQTINIARSYGQSYSGGASVFGGGDSNDIYRRLLEELLEKGEAL